MSSQESYLDALNRVIDEVVAPGAAAVDADGAFPRAQLDALGAAGILALTVPAEYGGGGGRAGGAGGGGRRRWWSARSAPPAGPPRWWWRCTTRRSPGWSRPATRTPWSRSRAGTTCPPWRSRRPGRGPTSGRRC